jgi:hypothetical protein
VKGLVWAETTSKAWYGRLRGFLFSKGFEMGKVENIFFSSSRVMIS